MDGLAVGEGHHEEEARDDEADGRGDHQRAAAPARIKVRTISSVA